MAIIACLGLAACGGSSSSSSTAGSGTNAENTITRAEVAARNHFLAQLNSACKRANAAYLKAKPANQPAVIQRYLGVFKSIKAPPLVKTTYSRYLGVLAKELAALKQGNPALLTKLRDTQAGPLVQQLGAKGCYG
jgi:hypothetical protein